MTAVRETILAQAKAELIAGTTAATVTRELDREVLFTKSVSELPHINVKDSGQEASEDAATSNDVTQQNMEITLNLAVSTEDPEQLGTELNRLIVEIVKVLHAESQTLGGAAQLIEVYAMQEPETEYQAMQSLMVCDLNVRVEYAHLVDDPETPLA